MRKIQRSNVSTVTVSYAFKLFSTDTAAEDFLRGLSLANGKHRIQASEQVSARARVCVCVTEFLFNYHSANENLSVDYSE